MKKGLLILIIMCLCLPSVVNAENNPPVAVNDYVTVLMNSSDNPIDVLANDYDPDGDSIRITTVATPPHGSVRYYATGPIYYTPNPNYVGSDSFWYKISDGSDVDVAIVRVTATTEYETETEEWNEGLIIFLIVLLAIAVMLLVYGGIGMRTKK